MKGGEKMKKLIFVLVIMSFVFCGVSAKSAFAFSFLDPTYVGPVIFHMTDWSIGTYIYSG